MFTVTYQRLLPRKITYLCDNKAEYGVKKIQTKEIERMKIGNKYTKLGRKDEYDKRGRNY